MDLLAAGYGSDSDDGGDIREEGAVPELKAASIKPAGYSDDDSDESSDESVDSAELRAAEAAARLRDFGETATSGRQAGQQLQGGPTGLRQKHPPATSMLPSALDVLDRVEGPPTFLDPEAIRPLAASALHGLSEEEAARLAGPSGGGGGGRGERQQPGKDFDISRLAPPLKGQAKQSADKRGAPPGAVIEGRAKRYKPEEGPEATQQYTAVQIAMMGGKVDDRAAKGSAAGPSKPMEVSEFLNKGVGAAQLPRRNQDRKDKEKEKRMRGQSSHSHWKSEAEMVLRQQFDS
ncbi:hypothetical protein PLESTF_001406500 [Pleodorina starrii]|nr:hypothetical protein PLESTM_001527000 [Pleodorina starrii]GLC73668.1 hypothetical protein PLESTF_001406500 [Pleodorina starrii]